MNRYCPNCKQEFDFPIRSITDLDNLVCPNCKKKVPKDSRKPIDNSATEKTEMAIGRGFAAVMHFFYIFYLICGVAGILAYFFNLNSLLYIVTGIALGTFFIQTVFRFSTFRTGFIFLPLGAVAGFLIIKTPQGACLGVHIVFLLRHLIRDIFWKLISKLISIGNK